MLLVLLLGMLITMVVYGDGDVDGDHLCGNKVREYDGGELFIQSCG